MEWLLDWAKLLYDHSERAQRLRDQHVLLASDLMEPDERGENKVDVGYSPNITPTDISPALCAASYLVSAIEHKKEKPPP